MFDRRFAAQYGEALDAIAEEIAEAAGTYDADWKFVLAAAQIIEKERSKVKLATGESS